jgi:hypothetical protein
MPATSDRNWDVTLNANAVLLDGQTALGGLAVTTTEYPSTTLRVAIASGSFIKSNGTVVTFAGQTPVVVPASSTTYVWLTDTGTVTTGTAFPTTAHLRLAEVVSGPTSILQILDQRVQCAVAGSGLGFLLKAGDTMNGVLTVATSSGTPVAVADPVNGLIGFFGTTPATQAASVVALSITAPGTPSNTIGDVGSTYSQTNINTNFVSLATKVDALITALKRHGLMGS